MPISTPDAPLSPRDVIRLYCAFNRRLTQVVRATTLGPAPVIEDACQVAWTGLICPGQGVENGRARAWLVRTAVREALRLMRLEAREASLERAFEEMPHLRSATDAGPEELVWRREQVESVRLLSVRQQRLVWLRALGFSYGEMARYEGVTNRTLRRQLERAQRRLQALDDSGQVDRAAA
ncbi:MAG TPA: sigma-70 family RNA polymerase sigma factor [Solirubrobacteraceae bacterium]|jgi:RNA polymerase sigma factor (sigma-70 family)